jgi:hypothetical protein
MKHISLSLLLIASLITIVSCSKPAEEEETCEDTHTTTVTYKNISAAPLRVVVSQSLTPQFVPVDPIYTIDLAPGESVVKTLTAGDWINSWYNGCPSACNRMNSTFRDYLQCEEYQEQQ